MNIGQIFKILLGRWWVIIATMALTVCITYFINQGKDDLLKARSTLLIDFNQPTSDTTLPAMLQDGYLATQSEIISSRRVAEKVIENLRLSQNQQLLDIFTEDENSLKRLIKNAIGIAKQVKAKILKEDIVVVDVYDSEEIKQQIIGHLLGQLKVVPRDNTRLIDVNFLSTDGGFAIDMANAFADAYVQVDLEFKTDSASRNAEWMKDQLSELRSKLDDSQIRLTEYEKRTGILASDLTSDDRANIELRHLTELTAELAKAQAEADFEENKLAQLLDLKQTGGDISSIPEVMSNQLLQSLKLELRRKEGELAELSAGLGKNHPDYRAGQIEIESLENELENLIENVAAAIRNQALLARSKAEALANAQVEQKAKLLEGRGTSSDLPALLREIQNAQQNYESALQRYEEYNLQSQINQTNVDVLSYADKTVRARIPKMAKNLILATILGFILGCAVAALLELRNPLIRGEKDIALIDLPYLGKINAG